MVASTRFLVLFFVSIFFILASFAGFIALMVVWQTKLTPFEDFSVVIDAGSSHSNIYVYHWPADKSDGLGSTSRVTQFRSCEIGPPITSISDPTRDNAQNYFQEKMNECVSQIPSTRKNRALIFLGGTAGLRLHEMKNSTYTDALLASTREYFGTLGLLFKSPENQVRIISGSEEGLSGWISTNILFDELYTKNQPDQTFGVSDIGGASTQISFVSPMAEAERYNLSLFNTDYPMYSHSYLCYGANEFRRRYQAILINSGNGSESIQDPCLQSDYNQTVKYSDIFDSPCSRESFAPSPLLNSSASYTLVGTGNYEQCLIAVQNRFNKENCSYSNCSFDNVYQPKPIPSSLKFIAMSAWYKTFKSLAQNVSDLSPNADGNYDFTTVNFTHINAAIQAVCSQSWFELNSTESFREVLCFNSMFHWTLLQYGYQMSDANLPNFHIIKNIGGTDIGWTLGYMINQTNYLEPEFRPKRLLTANEFGGLVAFCVIVFVSSIVLAVYFKHSFNTIVRKCRVENIRQNEKIYGS